MPALPRERLDFHVHAHLDVFVDGNPKPVAALIGIDVNKRLISPLHTHDQSGIVHIENDVPADFTLNQFFTEWAVRLDDRCVGGYCRPDKPWTIYVNGQEASGSPQSLVLHAHDEVAMVIGTPPGTIPAQYAFPEGF